MACPQAAGSQTREKAVSDISNPSTEQPQGGTGQPQGQTRREFIRKVLLTTAYVAPAIVSLSVTGMASAASQGGDSRRGGGSPMSPMSPMMRMMSPMEMETMMSMGNPGNIWK